MVGGGVAVAMQWTAKNDRAAMNPELSATDYSALADERLLALVGDGDRTAYTILYDRFAPRMFGLLTKLLRSPSHAEDVLQIVALDIWRRADRYDPALGSAATWLLMVTRARAIDAIRRSARNVAMGLDDRDDDTAEPFRPEPVRVEHAPKLAAAMEMLPKEQRTAVELAFYRGLTREEIAASLSIPVGTVKTRIRSAIRQLGATLGHGSATMDAAGGGL